MNDHEIMNRIFAEHGKKNGFWARKNYDRNTQCALSMESLFDREDENILMPGTCTNKCAFREDYIIEYFDAEYVKYRRCPGCFEKTWGFKTYAEVKAYEKAENAEIYGTADDEMCMME